MSVKRRLEKLEATLGGRTNLHYLSSVIFAREGETAIQAIARAAPKYGITLEQVGCAHVVWGDEHRLIRSEDYQIVDDVSKLIGWMSHDEWVFEIDRLEREEPEKIARWRQIGGELWRLHREQSEREKDF
jgi:hypothetical protein